MVGVSVVEVTEVVCRDIEPSSMSERLAATFRGRNHTSRSNNHALQFIGYHVTHLVKNNQNNTKKLNGK